MWGKHPIEGSAHLPLGERTALSPLKKSQSQILKERLLVCLLKVHFDDDTLYPQPCLVNTNLKNHISARAIIVTLNLYCEIEATSVIPIMEEVTFAAFAT